MRLFTKLLIAFVAIGILVAAAAYFVIERQLEKGFIRLTREEMTTEAFLIARMPLEEIARKADILADLSRSRLTLIDASGKAAADSDMDPMDMDDHLNRSEIQEVRLKGEGSAIRYSRSLKRDMLYIAVPLGDAKAPAGYIRLSRPLQDVSGVIAQWKRTLLTSLWLVVFFSLLLALLVSLWLILPIRKLAAFTHKFRLSGGSSGMIRIGSNDEIGELAESINGLIAVLQEKIRFADMEKRKLESVFSGMAEGIMVLGYDARIETVNRRMEEMIGRGGADLTGRTLLEAIRSAPLHNALERYLETGEPVFQEIDLADQTSARIMQVTISGLKEPQEGRGKAILVFHDVTRQKRLERIRTDFAANVTHEIRTPLTAIIGFVETLLQGALDHREKAVAFLNTIRQNAERLSRLVDDLLTLSAIELGEAKLSFEAVDVARALDQAMAVIAPKACEKGVTIVSDVADALPPLRADRDRLAQILLNVLDNAVKFSLTGGKVVVTAVAEQGWVAVRIADSGVGIPREAIPRLGERFYRADKARSRDPGGTGLGLSIVKHLLQAHGGGMAIDSVPGRGTTVSLRFPVYQEPA